MGLLRTAVKAGIAKKLYDEARKPQNQRLIKELVTSLANSRKPGPGGRARH